MTAVVRSDLRVAQSDVEAITRAARDYLEGYILGDPERHLGAYHPEAIKRRFDEDEDGIFGMVNLSPQTMADYAGTMSGTAAECEADIYIDDVSEDIAAVRVYSRYWVDFLHVVKARGEWRLLHVTWHRRDQPDGGS